MNSETITDQLGAELLEFLADEASFLSDLECCVVQLERHPLARAFQRELVEQLTVIQRAVSVRNIQRAKVQGQLAEELLKTPAAIRLSTVNAGPNLSQPLQERRQAVLIQARSVETQLRNVLGQMMESNVIVTAVLDAVLGVAVDRSRYDSDGRPVSQVNHIDSQRVA